MSQLELIIDYVSSRTGIELSRGGLREALEHYVHRRMRELELESAESYVNLLERPGTPELERLIEIVSVPHTWFFRDGEQMKLIAELLTAKHQTNNAINVWIPACATGEDAYTLALITQARGINATIVASDICARSLKIAQSAQYSAFSLRELPQAYLPYFNLKEKLYTLDNKVRSRVRFESHNLLSPPLSAVAGWDLILCRNVLIYFSPETASQCASRLGRSLREDGVIIFGVGELIGSPPTGLGPSTQGDRVFYSPSRGGAKAHDSASPMRPLVADSGAHRATLLATNRSETPLPSFRQSLAPPSANFARKEAVQFLLSGQAPSQISSQVLRLSTQNPLEPLLRLVSGIALYTAGDYSQSMSELRAALLLDDQLWPAALYHGLCLESMGKPQLAHTEYIHTKRLLSQGAPQSPQLPAELGPISSELIELARHKTRQLSDERRWS